MSQPQPGLVALEGMLEGPASSWSPSQSALEDALVRAGAPANLLRARLEGGRATVEAESILFPRGQFLSEPAEAVGMALGFALQEDAGCIPSGWFSNLRLTEYKDRSQIQVLFQLGASGVSSVTRESPWSPSPAETRLQRLARQWPIGLLILIAACAFAWWKWDEVENNWRRLMIWLGVEDTLQVERDAGDFADWIALDAEHGDHSAELRIVLSPKQGFPADAAAIDALRAGSDLPRRSALNALENGRARLELLTAEGRSLGPSLEVNLQPLRDGAPAVVPIDLNDLDARLDRVRLVP